MVNVTFDCDLTRKDFEKLKKILNVRLELLSIDDLTKNVKEK